MAPSKHSIYGASSASRNLGCVGAFWSARRVDDGVRRSSIYAAEGTLAHAIAEACLHTGRDALSFVGDKRHSDGFEFTIDEAFAEAVQVYVDTLRSYQALGYIIALERQVTPQVWWTGLAPLSVSQDDGTDTPLELFGTSDAVCYNPATGHVAIVDLKFGAGVAVEVTDNPQLLYYGAGSIHETVLRPLCADAGRPYRGVGLVTLCIVQPRAYHRDGPVRRADYDPSAVQQWARTTLYDGAKASLADDGTTVTAGPWCRWCAAMPHCTAPRQAAVDLARQAFAAEPLVNLPAPVAALDPVDLSPVPAQPGQVALTDDELGALLDKVELLEPWIRSLRELALARMEAGRPVTGWKRLPTRQTRRWPEDMDEAAVLAELWRTPLAVGDYTAPARPLTPAQIERNIGAAAYRQHVAPHVVKASSGVKLAADGDPRVRLSAAMTAAEAFAPRSMPVSVSQADDTTNGQ